MIRLSFLTLILTFKVVSSLGVNECQTLASICRRDPSCADERVFYVKCINRYVRDGNARLSAQNKITVLNWDWDPSQSTQALQERLVKIVIPNPFEKRSYSEYQENDSTESEKPKSNFDGVKVTNVLELYKAYKRESIRESLNLLRENTKHQRESKDSPEEVGEPRPQIQDTVLHDRTDEKTKILLHDAVHLLKTIIKKNQDTPSANSFDFVPIDKNQLEKDRSNFLDTKRNTDSSSIRKQDSKDYKHILLNEKEDTYNRVEDKSQDREEVALPVFSPSGEPDVASKNSTDSKQEDKGYFTLVTTHNLTIADTESLGSKLQVLLWDIKPSNHKVFSFTNVNQNAVTYHMVTNPTWFKFDDDTSSIVAKLNSDFKSKFEAATGKTIVSASLYTPNIQHSPVKVAPDKTWDHLTLLTAIIGGCTLALVVIALIVCSVKRRGDNSPVAFKKQEAVEDYQELCRTQMSVVNSQPEEEETEKENTMRNAWNDDTFPYNMDITTGHVILAYMEDHLKNENRLNKEWEALCNYKVEDGEKMVGADSKNTAKNRYGDVLPYDSNRVKLHEISNISHSDYINASFVTDADPRNPHYVATQGPLANTVADFWQLVWENGVVVIVNLTKLSDLGLPQCHRYWPEDGSEIYQIYEVHLISEHIWCDDYLVRSLYLKNLQTAETRTITQFHYLTWPDLSIPNSTKPLLEFRRKVNKCYRGNACPIIVHCNNGVGRTGTYILLDMVLNKMIRGAKEIDIAATLEHLRDQRVDMVKTKGQFEFALTAVAEEVTAILSAVPR